MKKISYNKKAMGMAELGALILMLIVVAITVISYVNKGDDIDATWDNTLLQTCDGPDGEGTVFMQNVKGWCPCDIDDKDSTYYTGKYYTLNESARINSGGARFIFDHGFLDGFSEENPLKISEKNVDALIVYLEARAKDSGTSKYVDLDFELNEYTREPSNPKFRPDIKGFCPSLSGNFHLCDKERFLKDWFTDDTYNDPQCKTETKDCIKKIDEKCNSEEE